MDKRGFDELPVQDGVSASSTLGVRVGALLVRALARVHRAVIAAFDWQWKRFLRAEERRVWSTMTPRHKADIGASPAEIPSEGPFDSPWPP